MGEQVANKISVKKILSFAAIGLAFIAIILFVLLPAIKIDQSFAFNEQVDAGKENFINLKDWCFRVSGIGAIFGGASYEAIKCGVGEHAYDIEVVTETTSFNIWMLIGIILAVATIALYGFMIIKKIKNATLNKVVIALFIAAALMILLSAVWFYAVNPIEESNYYNSVTKQDTLYKFCNAHLSAGPIVGSILLLGSGVCAATGEF